MNLKRMRYFVAVAEELHFGKAAQRLNVVQPAISQQIKLLEDFLGTHLFDRSSRRVALTEAGNAYLAEARQALQQFDLATQIARDAANGLVGTLAIGFVDNAIWSSMPSVIREFHKQYPRIKLNLVQMPRDPQLKALQNGELDIAIVPGPVLHKGIKLQELAREPLYIVLPADHPLAQQEEIRIAELANEPFVTFPSTEDKNRINEMIHALCADAGFAPVLSQPVQQMHTALSLVSAGLGISIVPRWLRHALTENVEYRPVTPRTDYVLLLATVEKRSRYATRAFAAVASGITAT